jgi:hypothetical protein
LYAAVLASWVSTAVWTPASATEPEHEIDVRWDAPVGCGDAESVRQHALRRLARAKGTPVTARGTVQAIDDSTLGMHLDVATNHGRESREIRAASCDALVEAAGLLIAVAVDPDAATREPVDPAGAPPIDHDDPTPQAPDDRSAIDRRGPAAAAAPRAAANPPAAAARRTRTPPLRRIDGAVRVELGARFARVLPRAVGFVASGAAAVRFPAARLELKATHAIGQSVDEPGIPDVGAIVSLTSAAVAGCWAPRRRRLEFPVCGGVELGAMRGRSFGATRNSDATSLFVAIPVDAGIIVSPVPRVGIVVLAEVAPTVRRPSFHLRDRERLFVAGPVGARAVIGVEVRFP